MATLKIAKDLFDLLYPIGTYYETSNADWTPSGAGWYGTWVEDTAGKTTVAKNTGTFNTLGASVGSESKDISHNHTLSNNGYAKLSMHRSGKICYEELTVPSFNANFYVQGSSGASQSEIDSWGPGLGGSTDNRNLSCNVIQPSVVVRRWHRTA